MRGAAEIADLPIVRMQREANERGVFSNHDETDLETDVDARLSARLRRRTERSIDDAASER